MNGNDQSRTGGVTLVRAPYAALAVFVALSLVLQPCCAAWALWLHSGSNQPNHEFTGNQIDDVIDDINPGQPSDLCTVGQSVSADPIGILATEIKSDTKFAADCVWPSIFEVKQEILLPVGQPEFVFATPIYLRFQHFLE